MQHVCMTCLRLLFRFAGNPKGVMLTHHTLVTAVASLQGFVDLGNIRMGPDDSFLSFLTLAHIFDRVVEEFMLSVGGHIGYWQVQSHALRNAVVAIWAIAICIVVVATASTSHLC